FVSRGPAEARRRVRSLLRSGSYPTRSRSRSVVSRPKGRAANAPHPKIAMRACYRLAMIGLMLTCLMGLLMQADAAMPLRRGERLCAVAGPVTRPAQFPASSLLCRLAGNLNSLLVDQRTRFNLLIWHGIIGRISHICGTNKKIPLFRGLQGIGRAATGP